MEERFRFVVLPYLRTSGPVLIRGIEFRSSKDLEGLADEAGDGFDTLFSMFFLRDQLQIADMTYAYLRLGDDTEANQRHIRRLREAQALIAYLYASPDSPVGEPFLRQEHCSLYLFRRHMVPRLIVWPDNERLRMAQQGSSESTPPPEDDAPMDIAGFEGIVNWQSYVWVVPGSRIYPPSAHLWLNVAQDIYLDFDRSFHSPASWGMAELVSSAEPGLGEVERRVFTALEWHNRSVGAGVSEEVALVNLSIAFESLLGLPQGEKLSARFAETVMTLLGPVQRLDSWLDQFYTARSKIVHEGAWHHLMYYAADSEHLKDIHRGKEVGVQYRTLTAYGRRIFRLCLNTIVSGALFAEHAHLASLFVTNQERLEGVCSRLAPHRSSPEDRLRSVEPIVGELHQYWLESEQHVKLETVIGAGKRILDTYLETAPKLPEEMLGEMRRLAKADAKADVEHTLEGFERLSEAMVVWEKALRAGESPHAPDALYSVVSSYVKYAAMPSFWIRAHFGFVP